jgi:pimeloyl-ACP methyl ester carboxylesterase
MATLNVMRWGQRDALRTAVALHGITANGGAMTEPGRWLAARGWQVIAPDLRGHGESERGDGDFSFASLLGDLAAQLPTSPDVLIGHSFGGTLAQLAVLGGHFTPRALVLEDPVSHFADAAAPRAMLDWDEANLPRSIDGLRALNPGWSRRDAAWKLLSLIQIDFADARAAFAGNAPWDLRPAAAQLAARQPTVWVLPGVSRFVPADDVARLRHDVGERALAIFPTAGHSIHRDDTAGFCAIVEHLGAGTWFH